MIAGAVRDPFRVAAVGYVVYGIFYWVGGLYLVSQGVGVAGGRAGGGTAASMIAWGLLGLVPLVAIPALLWWPWSWLGGWVSRRAFAWLVALLLALRAWKVGEIAARGGGSVPAPWGGEISFQAGASVFLVVTLMALALVARAAWPRRLPGQTP
jgi:hypothetical protein